MNSSVLLLGIVIVAAGLVMMVAPGPGVPVLLAGLLVTAIGAALKLAQRTG